MKTKSDGLLPSAYGVAGVKSVLRETSVAEELTRHEATERVSAQRMRAKLARQGAKPDHAGKVARLSAQLTKATERAEQAEAVAIVARGTVFWAIANGLFSGKAFGSEQPASEWRVRADGYGEYVLKSPEEVASWLLEAAKAAK